MFYTKQEVFLVMFNFQQMHYSHGSFHKVKMNTRVQVERGIKPQFMENPVTNILNRSHALIYHLYSICANKLTTTCNENFHISSINFTHIS